MNYPKRIAHRQLGIMASRRFANGESRNVCGVGNFVVLGIVRQLVHPAGRDAGFSQRIP